ncbi:hypothetical protein DPMN_053903 [Dreissena polymorpha]|uniref:Uncharacterized protein n=1 Tax=Dreissena polymorpha TaxID=45954 RepID=A0A9D4CNZ4_DREPO|nr:hypothetical protein DPMN_053903 [Dreissena polymorpha]
MWYGNIFEQDKNANIILINLLTKFHEDLTVNLDSRVLTRNMPAPGQPYFSKICLTKFHEDWTVNVTSRVSTKQMLTTNDGQGDHKSSDYSAKLKYLKTSQYIFGTNIVTNDLRVLTRKNDSPPINNAFQTIRSLNFKALFGWVYVSTLVGTNLLTKFHDDRK